MGAGIAFESPQAELWIFRAWASCTWSGGIPPPHLTRTRAPSDLSGRPVRVNGSFAYWLHRGGWGLPPALQTLGASQESLPGRGSSGAGSVAPAGSALPRGDCCPSPARAQASPGSCTSGSSL